MDHKFFVYNLLSFIAVTMACKSTHQSSLRFDHINDPQGLQHTKIFQDTITVCLKSQAEGGDIRYGVDAPDSTEDEAGLKTDLPAHATSLTIDQLKDQLPRAIKSWVEPLRSIAKDVKLVSDVVFLTEGCSDDPEANKKMADLSVYLVENSNGNVNGLYHYPRGFDARAIQLFRTADYSTVLHETGHAFGLSDTYEGNSSRCKFGQPRAVMCLRHGRHEVLQPDDVLGVQNKFCKIHGDRFPDCRDILSKTKPGMQPNVDEDGQAIFKVGISMQDVSDVYYQYAVSDLNSEFRPAAVQVALLFSKNAHAESYLKAHYEKTYGVGNVRITKAQINFSAVKIINVAPNSPAANAGLKKDMYLGMIEGEAIKSAAQVIERMKFAHSSPLVLGVANYIAPNQAFSLDAPLRAPPGLSSIERTNGWHHVSISWE